jgi:deoxyribonuclease (pyrimidine dimer)
MTRINIVPVKELCNKHLFAEYREMPRLVKNLHQSLNRKTAFSMSEIPSEYVLGKGHVKFFFNKFKFLHERHKKITLELLKRGYKLSKIDSDIFTSVEQKWYNDYVPDEKALEINRKRILDRLPNNPKYGGKYEKA